MWRDVQGSNNWRDLVKPLNSILRDEIVRYGEFVSACYKAFDLDSASKRYLNCKYGKRSMFEDVGIGNCGYEVTKYIYAAPGTETPRWIGYVAVASDEDEVRRLGRRDVLVTFRGTVTRAEWAANLMSALAPARLDPHDPRPDVKVESGFLSLYTSDESASRFSQGSCREQLLGELSRIITKHRDEELSITLAGHSMGSSLALLFGYDIAELGLNRSGRKSAIPTTVYSFAGPRVGNLGFKERCERLGVKVLRIVNIHDPVTKLPGVFLNENFRVLGGPWSCSCYAHVGIELALDFFKVRNPACVHDLETYIRLLKCPKLGKIEKNHGDQFGNWGLNFIHKAKELMRRENFDAWAWQDAARQVGNLVQSLGF